MTSTAQGHMNDKLRNHGLPVPKEADTAEPMSVDERCDIIWNHMRHRGGQGGQALFDLIAEQIRQAEQAAATIAIAEMRKVDAEWIEKIRAHERRKALEEAAQLAETFFDWCKPIGEHRNMAMAQEFGEEFAERIRALANSSEPGEDT